MRRRLPLACALIAAAASAVQAEAGRTGAITLSRPLGARASALADAFSAVPGGLDSLTYNPAGLAGLDHRQVRTDYTRGIVDDSFSFLGFAQPLGRLTLATGAAYYDAGTMSLNLSNGVRETRKVEQDWVGLLGGAMKVGSGLSVGGLAKYYRLTLAQEASARGMAFDAGALWRAPWRGLSFGAAVQNAGAAVKFEQEADPLPLTMRAGAAYELTMESSQSDQSVVAFHRFLFTADAIRTRDERTTAAAGIEMQMPLGGQNYGALRLAICSTATSIPYRWA